MAQISELLKVLKAVRDFEENPSPEILQKMCAAESPIVTLFQIPNGWIIQFSGNFADPLDAVRLVLHVVDHAQTQGLLESDHRIRELLNPEALARWQATNRTNGRIPPLLTPHGRDYLQYYERRDQELETLVSTAATAGPINLADEAQRNGILWALRDGEDRVTSNLAVGVLQRAILAEYDNSPDVKDALKPLGTVRTFITRLRNSCREKFNNTWNPGLAVHHDADTIVKLLHGAQIIWKEVRDWQTHAIAERLTGIREQMELVRFWAALNLLNDLPESDYDFVFGPDFKQIEPPLSLHEAGILFALTRRRLPGKRGDDLEWSKLDAASVELVLGDAAGFLKGMLLETPEPPKAEAIEKLWKNWIHVRVAHWRLRHPDRGESPN